MRCEPRHLEVDVDLLDCDQAEVKLSRRINRSMRGGERSVGVEDEDRPIDAAFGGGERCVGQHGQPTSGLAFS
jgi:hypothetical protein